MCGRYYSLFDKQQVAQHFHVRGNLKDFVFPGPDYNVTPDSTGFSRLNLAEEIAISSRRTRRKLVQPSLFPSILRLAGTFGAEDPTSKEHTCIVESDDYASPKSVC